MIYVSQAKKERLQLCVHVTLEGYERITPQRMITRAPEYKEEVNIYCVRCNRTYTVIVPIN